MVAMRTVPTVVIFGGVHVALGWFPNPLDQLRVFVVIYLTAFISNIVGAHWAARNHRAIGWKASILIGVFFAALFSFMMSLWELVHGGEFVTAVQNFAWHSLLFLPISMTCVPAIWWANRWTVGYELEKGDR